MTDPFDAADAAFLALVNDERQHCLWPAFAAVPAGWAAVHGPAARDDCLDYIVANWPDARPLGRAA